jgi:phenylacetate-coenzyme A ligase PaaK-like adenylate-forming protein
MLHSCAFGKFADVITAYGIFGVTRRTFDELAMKVFRHQLEKCDVYRAFCHGMGKDHSNVNSIDEIPFLPVEFFKTHRVYSSDLEPEIGFTSSGTTGQQTSRHLVAQVSLYDESFLRSFMNNYGDPAEYVIAALLPSYLERKGSSLVYMTNALIKMSQDPMSGFFLDDHQKLSELLKNADAGKKKVLLLGVTYALLDHAEKFPQPLKNTIIMETGGMKGRRREMVREEVHDILKKAFAVNEIHSEYGMTELLSQAYSKGNGIYMCPNWMRVVIREMNDPMTAAPDGKTGGVNIIDLANVNSCSFISTADLGRRNKNGTFEILGRFDNSDLRGCNLMVD